MNIASSNRLLWVLWLLLSSILVTYFAHAMFSATDKTVFMPGPLSAGHHQLAQSCESCHTDSLGGGEVLQASCESCHGDVRVKPFDSHPVAKFEDPRNADLLLKVNVTQCVSCHTEHKPEITIKDGLTQPLDVCYHCHSDVGENRPSHKDMSFMTCKDAGCHNFHNNRALYTDFLIKHMDALPINQDGRVPEREFASIIDQLLEYPRDLYPLETLDKAAADMPLSVAAANAITEDWHQSSHAQAGVNCSACHQAADESGQPTAWIDKPGTDGCASCHGVEVQRFGLGKHGMRLAAGLSPMTPAQAQLSMSPDVAHQELTCSSCHGAHQFDVEQAAVESCLSCHTDDHSLAYKKSSHYQLWLAEIGGDGAVGSGVSCATCHMPRIDFDVDDYVSRKMVDHNQSATLSPNSKMIRPACLACHGLPFAIDAMADRELIERNFQGRPTVHVQSVDLARQEQERHERERAERK
ncbi:MAG: cytochrome c3 family protein [Burkholderiaceae bacterium]